MGCGQSIEAGDVAGGKQNAAIEAQLRQDRAALKSEVKMLLLGAGESGKSTIVKQMRLIYRDPYADDERTAYKEIAFSNTLQSCQAVIRGFALLNVTLPPHLVSTANYLSDIAAEDTGDHGYLDPKISTAIQTMWDDPSTKRVVEQANLFQLNDSAQYFFDALPRISSTTYTPSDQDILRTRVRSTGITEERFAVKQYTLRVFDVGGQRSERKKWIHCFENVQVLLFVAAINEYDQQLWEDESVNRLSESSMLFESITSSRWFDKSSFVLLLNKVDLFELKILAGTSPLSKAYPEEFMGRDGSVEDGKQFMKHRFLGLDRKRERRAVYCHFSCATDTSQVKVVMAAVLDTVLSNLLNEVGLL